MKRLNLHLGNYWGRVGEEREGGGGGSGLLRICPPIVSAFDSDVA